MNTNEPTENYDSLQALFLQMDHTVDEDILSEMQPVSFISCKMLLS